MPRLGHNRGGAMYRLRDLKDGMYQIHSKKQGAMEGPLQPIFRQAIEWGVVPKDLIYAIRHLKSSGDDYADFGIFGSFIFSMKDKKKVG